MTDDERLDEYEIAARFLLDLADEGGELWAGAIVTDESRHVVRNAVCWALYGDGTEQVSIGDAQKAEGFRIADHALDQFVDFQRSRVRVWPKEDR